MIPKDYEDRDSQQIIVLKDSSSSSASFSKLKDAVFFALIIAVGGLIWNMSQRMATVETLVRIIAKKSGVDLP